jgi:hypothetical protein
MNRGSLLLGVFASLGLMLIGNFQLTLKNNSNAPGKKDTFQLRLNMDNNKKLSG